jgi:uncharacterized C2H2 Zn-finger protein
VAVVVANKLLLAAGEKTLKEPRCGAVAKQLSPSYYIVGYLQ